ncbi:10267_t:CDS:1 [Ambispora gerdemannii]|uniref:10267_t:CDS:1 n=1 Tax=Ambispora gerdemannii TaxID=144530 RepID=A0A9N9FZI4_9GLOM|nr:10267_t:CDS:1 [Ambispora gerdemannii]
MAEIASQQTPPFADSSTDDKVNDKISQEKRPTVPADLNSDYKLLMESCWHQNPRVRPSIEIVRSELQVLLNTSSTQNKPHDLSVITTHGVHKLLDEEFHHVFSTAPSPSLSVIGSMDDEDENSYPKALYLFDSKHHIHEHDNNVLDWKEVMRLHNKKLYAEAYPHLEEYAKREGPNSIQAKYLIGWYLLDGREGVIQDERDAMKYLRQVSDDSPTLYKAAAQYLFARGCLKGSMYDKGTGLAYLEMAVKARDKHALFWYADILLNGEHDLPVDIKRAEELFKEAKSRGHPDAEDALEKLKSS